MRRHLVPTIPGERPHQFCRQYRQGFRADTGKPIASINGHAGVFHATSHEGVSTLLTGNSGKGSSSSPDRGGFTGWATLGINANAGVVGHDPAPVTSRTNWLRVEVKPRVDELTLGATVALPAAMTVGDSVTVDATISRDGGRIVPVRWPMSAVWGGDAVVVDDGSVETDKRGAAVSASASESAGEGVVRFNPLTGALTATAAGEATLEVTVNGVTTAHAITVADDTTGPVDPGGPGEQGGPGESGDGGDDGSGNGSGNGTGGKPGSAADGEGGVC